MEIFWIRGSRAYLNFYTPKQKFTGDERAIAERLKNNEVVPFTDVFSIIYKLVLSQLGKAYDFSLDFESFEKMSCTEFVYYCTKSLEWCVGVRPVIESVVFIKAPGIAPDAFLGSPQLGISFASQSVLDMDVIRKIKNRYPGPYGG